MTQYKLTIAYNGTRYSGWQVQPNGVSVQAQIQDALKLLFKEDIVVIGSGRTDAGVHALGQVAHFKTEQTLDPYRIRAALNGILPHDIRIKEVVFAPEHFHARFSAIGKTYHYNLHLHPVDDPFTRPFHLHVKKPVDLPLLREATREFVGTRDFTSFANEPGAGAVARNPVRTLKRLDIVPTAEGVRLEFEGDGFLYKMVRNIVGTLLEVSTGKRDIEQIPAIFAAKDRRKAGIAAQAHGLFLVKVDYPLSHLEHESASLSLSKTQEVPDSQLR